MKIFKQIAAVTVATVMAAGTMCVDTHAASDTYKLYVSSNPASAAVGDTVKVSVLIDIPDVGIGTLVYKLNFDTDYLEYQAGSAQAGLGVGMEDVNVNDAANGQIGYAFMIANSATGTAKESLSLEFKVLKVNAELTLSDVDVGAGDEDGTDITDKGTVVGAKVNCSHKNTEKKTTPATCKDEGKEETTCKDCNEVIDTKTLPKTDDHDWGEWETDDGVKCGEKAKQTRTCKVCGKTETKEGAVVEHIWDNGTITTAPTCTEAGVKTYTCTRNGCDGTKTESIDALGHDLDDGTVTTAPTCTEAGVKTYSCKRDGCDYTKTEAVDALGHDLDDGTETKAPTCTEAGEKTYTCKRTGCDYTKTEAIDALGHDVSVWETTKEATCTEAGEKTGECARCGEEVTEEIPAPGHQWSEWEVTKEPTANTEGERTRTCAVCEETETETIDKLPSDEPSTIIVDNTSGNFVPVQGTGSGATTTTAATSQADETNKPAETDKPAETNKPADNTTAAPAETTAAQASDPAVDNGQNTTAQNTAPVGDSNVSADDKNQSTGLVLAVVPAVIAAAAGIVVARKRK